MKLWHKIAIGGTVTAVGLGALAYDKFKRTKRIFEQLSYFPKISNLDVSLQRVKFDLRVALTNPVNDDLSLSTGGLVKLTKFFIYDIHGKVLSVLRVNDLYKIQIPAYSTFETPKITVEIPTTNLIDFLPNLLNFQSGNTDQIAKALRYGFEIKTFYGETYTYTTF